MGNLFQALGGNRHSLGRAREERTDFFRRCRAAEGDEQHRIIGGGHCVIAFALTLPAPASERGLSGSLSRAELMNHVNHGDDVINRSLWQDAVTEIENMAGLTAGAAQYFAHPALDFFGRCEERDRIEVTLNSNIMSNRRPTCIEIDAPV